MLSMLFTNWLAFIEWVKQIIVRYWTIRDERFVVRRRSMDRKQLVHRHEKTSSGCNRNPVHFGWISLQWCFLSWRLLCGRFHVAVGDVRFRLYPKISPYSSAFAFLLPMGRRIWFTWTFRATASKEYLRPSASAGEIIIHHSSTPPIIAPPPPSLSSIQAIRIQKFASI